MLEIFGMIKIHENQRDFYESTLFLHMTSQDFFLSWGAAKKLGSI